MAADEIPRRNAAGVMETLRRVEAMVYEQKLAIAVFSEQVGELTRRVGSLEQAEAVRRIAAMGSGPTEK